MDFNFDPCAPLAIVEDLDRAGAAGIVVVGDLVLGSDLNPGCITSLVECSSRKSRSAAAAAKVDPALVYLRRPSQVCPSTAILHRKEEVGFQVGLLVRQRIIDLARVCFRATHVPHLAPVVALQQTNHGLSERNFSGSVSCFRGQKSNDQLDQG